MAPEVMLGKGHGLPVDLWGVGILLYEMLTGATTRYDANHHSVWFTGTTPYGATGPQIPSLKIVDQGLKFPKNFSSEVKAFMSSLLVADPNERLGCGTDGYRTIHQHDWFRQSEFRWDLLSQAELPPPFPPKQSPLPNRKVSYKAVHIRLLCGLKVCDRWEPNLDELK